MVALICIVHQSHLYLLVDGEMEQHVSLMEDVFDVSLGQEAFVKNRRSRVFM